MSLPVLSGMGPPDLSVENILRPPILFQLASDNGFARIQCYVNGTLAYDSLAGGLQPGYVSTVNWSLPGQGGVGGVSIFGGTATAGLQQVAFLPQNTTIPVRVVAADTSMVPNVLDQTWHFDTTNNSVVPLIQNLASDGYVDVDLGVFSVYDPFRFDLVVDPVVTPALSVPGFINLTTLNLTIDGAPVITAGVPQAGWTVTALPILGGYRYEVYPAVGTWSLFGALATIGVHATFGDGDRSTGMANIPIAGQSGSPNNPIVTNASVVDAVLTGATADMQSGLGVPTLDTLHVAKNAGAPLSIYAGGVFLNGWNATQAPANQGPAGQFSPGPFQDDQLSGWTLPAPLLDGDVLVFTATGHRVSPSTGVNYPIVGTWTWTASVPLPPSLGKKYAVELHDPTTIIVRTSVDGVLADCDFNLSIRKVRNVEE